MSSRAAGTRGFLAEAATSPFCAGCGYRQYVEQLDRALVDLDLDPAHVAIVTDIGCVGAIGAAFASPHTMHTTHGRSVAFATGVELADAVLHDSRLKTIVAVGDGGAMTGLSHLLNAALLNVDLTVLVANNGVLALSGGQASCACPHGPQKAGAGMPAMPALDVCALAAQCGAGFVARAMADDEDMWRVMAKAIAHPGFALVEVILTCPRYAVESAAATQGLADRARQEQIVGAGDTTRPEFQQVYASMVAAAADTPDTDVAVPQLYSSPLRRPLRWLIAGSASEQVDWAAGVLTRAVAISGAYVAQKNDTGLPGSGFAVSEVCMSQEEIGYIGGDEPDVLVIASEDGLHEVDASGILPKLVGRGVVVIDRSLPEIDTTAVVIRAPLRTVCTPERAAMAGILVANRRVRAVAERAVFAAIQMSAADVSLYRADAARVLESFGG